jgi:CRP-like cAMP-binding protein
MGPGSLSLVNLLATMRQVEHFRELPDKELLDIIQGGRIEDYSSNEFLFVENEPCAGLFVLLTGQVHLCKHSIQGQKSIISIIDPVLMFNEVATLDEGPNPVTAVAAQSSRVWRIDEKGLDDLIIRYPRLGIGLLRILAGRNRLLVSQFEDLSFRPVLARTAKLLLQLSENGHHTIDRRSHPNHQMAALLSTVPEAFSRALKQLRKEGLITTTDKSITVHHPKLLDQIVQ